MPKLRRAVLVLIGTGTKATIRHSTPKPFVVAMGHDLESDLVCQEQFLSTEYCDSYASHAFAGGIIGTYVLGLPFFIGSYVLLKTWILPQPFIWFLGALFTLELSNMCTRASGYVAEIAKCTGAYELANSITKTLSAIIFFKTFFLYASHVVGLQVVIRAYLCMRRITPDKGIAFVQLSVAILTVLTLSIPMGFYASYKVYCVMLPDVGELYVYDYAENLKNTPSLQRYTMVFHSFLIFFPLFMNSLMIVLIWKIRKGPKPLDSNSPTEETRLMNGNKYKRSKEAVESFGTTVCVVFLCSHALPALAHMAYLITGFEDKRVNFYMLWITRLAWALSTESNPMALVCFYFYWERKQRRKVGHFAGVVPAEAKVPQEEIYSMKPIDEEIRETAELWLTEGGKAGVGCSGFEGKEGRLKM